MWSPPGSVRLCLADERALEPGTKHGTLYVVFDAESYRDEEVEICATLTSRNGEDDVSDNTVCFDARVY